MLPDALLRNALGEPSNAHGDACPRYLDESDEHWLQALLSEYRRFAGHRRGELDARMREPLPVPAPGDKLARARHVLDRLVQAGPTSPKEARRRREALFTAAADRRPRKTAVQDAARALQCSPEALLSDLFSDLPSERELPAPPEDLNPTELRLRTNLALVQGLRARSHAVTIALWGQARAIVRLAQLRGLLCTVTAPPRTGTAMPLAELHLSGPLSLFRRTRMYGSALASLVPHLCRCDRFVLRAQIQFGEQPMTLRVETGAPVFPAAAPKPYDSKLEARFGRDFGRLALDWDLHHEPAPVRAGDTLTFPDFALQHRRDPSRRALLEIAGFWTVEYLRDKLRHLRAAGIDDLILCIDDRRACDEADLPEGARIIRYRRRIDPRTVLALIEPVPS